MPDILIACVCCDGNFMHTKEEQAFFEKMGFKNLPKRCHSCRKDHRAKFADKPANNKQVEDFGRIWRENRSKRQQQRR
jgi:hypothetical protein